MRKETKSAVKMKKAETPQKIKVMVHIPDIVPRRQEKINRIYDILSPARPSQKAM